METVKDRINTIISELNLSKSKFSTKLGYDPINFRYDLKIDDPNRYKGVSSQIEKVFGYNSEWIMSGRGPHKKQ